MADAALWLTVGPKDGEAGEIVIMGEAPHSVGADVTWSYSGQPRERFCYQLVRAPDGWRIAVLTPIELQLRTD